MFKIGCHLSASKGYLEMAKVSEQIGANTFQFSPTINIQGSADRAVIESVLADAMQDFEARMDAWEARKQRRKARTVYR